jgi:hypothetical protein
MTNERKESLRPMRGDATTELFHGTRVRSIDRGTTMSEEMAFSIVGQRTARLLGEAGDERMLGLERDRRERVGVRMRIGHALIGLGGRIAGVRPVIPPRCDPARPSA